VSYGKILVCQTKQIKIAMVAERPKIQGSSFVQIVSVIGAKRIDDRYLISAKNLYVKLAPYPDN